MLYLNSIANFVVPFISLPLQLKIAALVEESYFVRMQSKRLLEIAKRAVELAIEEDEARALNWIEAQEREG